MLSPLPHFDFLRVRSEMTDYPHRQNKDGSIDSICPKCFMTVSSDRRPARLLHDEKGHVCEAGDLRVPETKKEYERSKRSTTRRRAQVSWFEAAQERFNA